MLVLLLLFWVQSVWEPFHVTPLAGYTPQKPYPELTMEAWVEEDFQHAADFNTKRAFGFRSMIVRLVNQIRYSVFDEFTPWLERGDDGFWFETAYRNSVCGEDFIGAEEVKLKVDSLAEFQNQLLSKGKRLIILIAPNKWRTLKSKVDWNCDRAMTNYEVAIKELSRRGFAVCDALELFCYNHHHKPKHPLHSKQGTHWSLFGAATVMDYLRFSFSQEGIELPELSSEKVEVSNQPRHTDKDLHDLLNIMMPPEEEELAYPELEFSNDYKPKVTVIGDSYYWSFYFLNAHEGLFSMDSKFFYYNRSWVGQDQSERNALDDEFRREEILSSDAVLMVMSEPSLRKLGYGIQRINLKE